MLEVDPKDLDAQLPLLFDELLTGGGALVIRGAFPPEEIAEARALSVEPARQGRGVRTHGAAPRRHAHRRRVPGRGLHHGLRRREPDLPRRPGSGAAHRPPVLGSLQASRLPDGDQFELSAAQATVLLDDFTEENRATAYLPGSQKTRSYPYDEATFHANAARQTGRAGDCVVFNGMVWHCAMPNRSDDDRTGVLIEYLAKFVMPLEDQGNGVRPEVIGRASPMLRRLMCLDYPYPQILDQAEAGVEYGRYARR